jgi:hypothetical protein
MAPLRASSTTAPSWAPLVITGPTVANLITITVFKQRCFYIEKNTMSVWYSASSAFQGALTQIPLGQLFKKGGTLVQMATWTIDNVSGMDDYAAFITSEGEVAIYQGYDPAQISTWSLIGIFNIGRPIGTRCIARHESDVLCITADGITPLSKALLTDREQSSAQLSDKIQNEIGNDVASYSANYGWQIVSHPIGNKIIVNVPETANVTSHQWVFNPDAKSWWRFKAMERQLFRGAAGRAVLRRQHEGLSRQTQARPIRVHRNPGRLQACVQLLRLAGQR